MTSHYLFPWRAFSFLVYSLLTDLNCKGASQPSLLPFQGRVSDAEGAPLPVGPHMIRFRISESPVDNTYKWQGELHRATVNGGLINVVLGTKTPLEGVDFSKQLFLEVTVNT